MKRTVARALAAIVMLPEAKKTIVEKKDGGSRFCHKKGGCPGGPGMGRLFG